MRNGILLSANDACASQNAFIFDYSKPDRRECRKASVGNATTEDELKRPDGPSNDCLYVTYDDFNDKDKPLLKTDIAQCGFNKDSAAYCSKRKGDSWYQAVLKQLQSVNLSGLRCHALSNLSNCGSTNVIFGKELIKSLTREYLATDESYLGWALFANNGKCVASSITDYYWMGDSPKSDHGIELSF